MRVNYIGLIGFLLTSNSAIARQSCPILRQNLKHIDNIISLGRPSPQAFCEMLDPIYISPNFYPSQFGNEQSNISGWKRAGICAAEFGAGSFVSLGVLFFSSLFALDWEYKPQKEIERNIILSYTIGNIIFTNSSIYLTGKALGLKKSSFIKTTIGTTIGSLIGAPLLLKSFDMQELPNIIFWFTPFLPVIGGVIGSNL